MGKINDDSQDHFLTLTERVARLESRQIASFAPASPAEAQEIPRRGPPGAGGRSVFRWQDENGQPGYAEGIGNVPARYRSKARPWTGPSAVAGN